MSVSINDIKKKILATENMSKITKAMQMVSVAKLGKTESRIKHFKNYHAEIKAIVSTLKDSEHLAGHPFSTGYQNKKAGKIGCVVITSNRGLVGGYNNNLFKLLKAGGDSLQVMSEKDAKLADFKFYVTGQKGAIFAKNELPQACTELFLFADELSYTDILELASKLIADYLDGQLREIIVVYQDFISKLSQEPTQKVLLPLKLEGLANARNPNYEIAPDEITVIDDLLVQYVMTSLYEIFLSANMSEHAARMNSMSNATDNAEDIIKESKLIYNRARQAAITQELNEIVAGASAVN